jgi:phosphoadenosine phosphosulfate reductase
MLWGDESKVEKSIDIIKAFEAKALQLHPDGYYLTYSGGKDSDVNLELMLMAGVEFSVHYNITGIDPKQAVIHIKKTREMLKAKGIKLTLEKPNKFTTGIYKGLPKNMWRLIVHKGMPPTRIMRYCCDQLKEHGGKGRLCVTGVRRAESAARQGRKSMEIVTTKFKDKKLFSDNDEGRLQFENCMQKGKLVLNPIIDWTDEDVWQFLRERERETCILYEQGAKRIGCLGCPIGSCKGQEADFKNNPWVKNLYIKAFDEMLVQMWAKGIETTWKTGQDVFDWWLYSSDKDKQKFIDGQRELFEEEESED